MELEQRNESGAKAAGRKKETIAKVYGQHAVKRSHTSGTVTKEYHQLKEGTFFPEIGKDQPGISSLPSTQKTSSKCQSLSERLHDLFFTPRILDSQRISDRINGLKDSKAGECHWKVPYRKLSEDINSKVKTHLKLHFRQRHLKEIEPRGSAEVVSDEEDGSLVGSWRRSLDLNQSSNSLMPGPDGRLSPWLQHSPTDDGGEMWSSGLMDSLARGAEVKPRPQLSGSDDSERFAPSFAPGARAVSPPSVPCADVDKDRSPRPGHAGSPGAITLGCLETRGPTRSQDKEGLSVTRCPNHAPAREQPKHNGGDAKKAVNADSVGASSHPRPPEMEETHPHGDHSPVDEIMNGNINLAYPPKRKLIMIYICGNYKDTEHERNALMNRAYPQLYKYCKERGHDILMVDLRWGVKDGISDQHTTTQLHLEVLKECQQTQGANFILLVGQKHDSPYLPDTIIKDEFEAIFNCVEKERLARAKERRLGGGASEPLSGHAGSRESAGPRLGASSRLRSATPGRRDLGGIVPPPARHSQTTGAADPAHNAPPHTVDPGNAAALLRQWYKLDENRAPSAYRLQPISAHFQEFYSKDPARRQQARNSWSNTSHKLWSILQIYAPLALGQEASSKLLETVIEQEVKQGLQTKGSPENHCLWFKRHITDIEYNLSSERAADYIDVLPRTPQLNLPVWRAHSMFLDTIHARLRHTNIYEYKISWGRDGISPHLNRSHFFYTEHLCNDFRKTFISSFNRIVGSDGAERMTEKANSRHAVKSWVEEEVLEHVDHCHTLSSLLMGRESFLLSLKECLQQSKQRVVVLLGDAGCGKSSLVAKASILASEWISGELHRIVRFVGVTGESRSIRLLLHGLCVQLAKIYNQSIHFSEEFSGLLNEFTSLLELATEDHPLLISLDGLDELSDDYDAQSLSWFPRQLPMNVRIIVSVTAGENEAALTVLKDVGHVLDIPPLTPVETERILGSWLARDGRRLAADQWALLVGACRACPSPLYLQCAYAESLGWRSSTAVSDIYLPLGVHQLYAALLSRLEKVHGEALVRRAAGLLAVSRNGATFAELTDLLSLDRAVVRELCQLQGVSAPRVPAVTWMKLRRDLQGHLVERRSDGAHTYTWAHSALRRACANRYLASNDDRLALHLALADYFSGKSSPGGPEDLHAQPLAWARGEGPGVNHTFNLRRLNGLPHHLLKAGQVSTLITQCLFNFQFLLHKVWALSVVSVEEDLRSALTLERKVGDLNLLHEAIQLSKKVLLQDPRQLASQLVGRLQQIVTEDKPVAPDDPRKYPHLLRLLNQCQRSSMPFLVPSFTCLLPPGGLLYSTLTGHTDRITAVTCFQKGLRAITASRDGTLKIWDLNSGKALHTVHGVGKAIDSITLCLQNTLAAVTEDNALQLWDIHSGQQIFTVTGSLDPPIIRSALDGQHLLAFYDGSHFVKIFDVSNCCRLLHLVDITPENNPIHKDHTVLVSEHSLGDQVLFAYRSGREGLLLSSKLGKVVAKLPARDDAASIQGVAVTTDYFLLVCRYPCSRLRGALRIELFAAKGRAYVRTVSGCCDHRLTFLSVNHSGSHLLALSSSRRADISAILSWNLETEDHKHLAEFQSAAIAGTCRDLRFCLAVCKGENFLRVWNLASRINDQALAISTSNMKSDYGIVDITPMKNNPSYVVCRSLNSEVISVWNIRKSKCKGQAVQMERGLVDGANIALVRDTKLYILSDKGMATHSETPRPIYQTLLIYDLLKRRYTTKLTDLHIIPCLKHEYRILASDQLLGLSEYRDHLVLWSLKTGFIKERVRPNYKGQLCPMNGLPSHSNHDFTNELLTKRTRGGDVGGLAEFMTPWEKRTETKTARRRRLDREMQREITTLKQLCKEKSHPIDQYLLSGDDKMVVCSYFAHHLAVFNLETETHTHTLEDRASMLLLHCAALTDSGRHLVLSNYNDEDKASYVTLWDLCTGKVRKRLKNEPNVCCIAMTDSADRIVFGIAEANRVKVWDPFRKGHKTIPGYKNLNFGTNNSVYLTDGGSKAIILAGDVSVWDLDGGNVLSIFTPDSTIATMTLATQSNLILLSMSNSQVLITLKLTPKDKLQQSSGGDMFGEASSSSSEDESQPLDQPSPSGN